MTDSLDNQPHARCTTCGSTLFTLVEQEGDTVDGEFYEKWRCEACGKIATISGDASDPPSQWTRVGMETS